MYVNTVFMHKATRKNLPNILCVCEITVNSCWFLLYLHDFCLNIHDNIFYFYLFFFFGNEWFCKTHSEQFSIFHSVFRISLTNLKVRKFLCSIWKSTKLRKVLPNKPFFKITLQNFSARKQLVKSSLNIDSERIICIPWSKRTWKVCLLLSIFNPRLSHFIHRHSLHYNEHIWLLKSHCISYHLLDNIM